MNNRKENEQSCIVMNKKRVHRALLHTSLYFREKSTLLIKNLLIYEL